MKPKFQLLNQYGFHAHSHHVNYLLGLSPTQKLPKEGMPMRVIQGVTVWVEPLADGHDPKAMYEHKGRFYRKGKRSTHRVLCFCPGCGHQMSVGRLHQHICKGVSL